MNEAVDLIDLQAMKNGSFHYIMHYVEYLKKCSFLAALEKQDSIRSFPWTPKNISWYNIGAPHVFQSDNGCEFNYRTNNAKTFPHVASVCPCK